jgi:cytochrome c-type biogenesis protein CcmH/NrfG
MEPNDQKLKELLQTWKAPTAPATLTQRVLLAAPTPRWWQWLWTGSIRVPVPIVGLAVLVVVAVMLYWSRPARQTVSAPEKPVSLADFHPVEQLEPRIIRSTNYDH